MKKILATVLLAPFLITSCNKDDIAEGTPVCIKNEIGANRNNTQWYGEVVEYTFQAKTVYAFVPDSRIIADASTEVKDEGCNSLCSVGGYGGPNVVLCNGDNFFQSAIFKRSIWKKP
jgi:hypothetical protein